MSSKSLAIAMFSGLRVAGELQYIPASVRPDGKEIQARCIIPVYENTARADAAGVAISHQFRLTAWGALADVCAKSLPKGKEFSAVVSPRQYKGRVFYSNMAPVNDFVTGQPLMTNKVSFNIDEISFGADSREFLVREIQEFRRGPEWDKPGTQDHVRWLARVAEIKAVKYVPGDDRFGYAKVFPNWVQATSMIASPQPNPTAVGTTFGAPYAPPAAHPGIPAGYGYTADGNLVPLQQQGQAAAPVGSPLY
jgi:hypothetical protein